MTGAATSATRGGDCVTEARRLVEDYRTPLELEKPPGPVDMLAMNGQGAPRVSLTNTPFLQDVMDGFSRGVGRGRRDGEVLATPTRRSRRAPP
jgi:hypothetical protein